MALHGHRPSPDDGVMSLGRSHLSLDEDVSWLCDLCRLVTDKEQNRGVDKYEIIRSMKKREHKL